MNVAPRKDAQTSSEEFCGTIARPMEVNEPLKVMGGVVTFTITQETLRLSVLNIAEDEAMGNVKSECVDGSAVDRA